MRLASLLIRHFRLIGEASLELGSGMQLFLGLNAQGKTSLIEAIVFLSTSTSHRTHKEEELIQWGEETAYLRGRVERLDGEETLACGLEKKRKSIKADDVALPRVGDLYGRLRTVLFAPEDMAVAAGGPAERRRYVDMAIAQIDPSYIGLLQQYRRLVKQRNQLLKRMQLRSDNSAQKELAVWDAPFLDAAAKVTERRGRYVRALAPLVTEYYGRLADDGPCVIHYPAAEPETAEDIRARLAERLERSRGTEAERGNTLIGPHRDDMPCTLAGKSLAQFGSQGQRRAAALSLRLAEARAARDAVGETPLLLIDDVVYEMDNTRRARFWDSVDRTGQLIVTAADLGHLGARIEPAQIFEVNHGSIHPAAS
ncbi:MAG: DNA replication/repair protein RecF [bacterium]|nr:DNA replication/repair protein RecF [bacterium]